MEVDKTSEQSQKPTKILNSTTCINQTFDVLAQSTIRAKEEIYKLMSMKNQLIINAAQFDRDINNIKTVYNLLKSMLVTHSISQLQPEYSSEPLVKKDSNILNKQANSQLIRHEFENEVSSNVKINSNHPNVDTNSMNIPKEAYVSFSNSNNRNFRLKQFNNSELSSSFFENADTTNLRKQLIRPQNFNSVPDSSDNQSVEITFFRYTVEYYLSESLAKSSSFLKINHNINDDSIRTQTITMQNLQQRKSSICNIKQRYSIRTTGIVCSSQFDPTGELIISSDGNFIFGMLSKNGDLRFQIELPKSPQRSNLSTQILRISPDSSVIASTVMNSNIALFSMKSHQLLGILEFHKRTISSLLFLKTRNLLLSGSYDGRLCVWDIVQMKLKRVIQVNNEDRNNSSSSLNTFQHGIDSCGAIVSISVDINETIVIVGFLNGTVGIYDIDFNQPVNIFVAHHNFLLNMSALPRIDSCLIVTTSQDNTAKIWELKGIATCKHTLENYHKFVLTSYLFYYGIDNKDDKMIGLLTGGKDEMINGWNVNTGEIMFSIKCQKNSIFEIDHHPNDRCFVSSSGDGTICVWDYDVIQI